MTSTPEPPGGGAVAGEQLASAFLTAEWRHLLMLNYEIEPQVLQPYVPAGATLDRWDGRTLVSIVGLRFVDTRVLGVAVPLHRDFDEINLRFYVRSRADPERRGVVFIKEVVPRRAIAAVARWVYNENYVACRTRSDVDLPSAYSGGHVEYEWTRGEGTYAVRAEFEGPPALPQAGSEPEFITEHYWGYVAQRDGSSLEYRVEHPQWRVWSATRASTRGDLGAFYGAAFAPALGRSPSSAFVAEGSPVVVRRGRRIAPDRGAP